MGKGKRWLLTFEVLDEEYITVEILGEGISNHYGDIYDLQVKEIKPAEE